jgi:hypothetical protein
VTTAILFGGYGTFGSLAARELACTGITVTVAGRDQRRAEAFARSLGRQHRALAVDLTRPADCLAALTGQRVAVNCAGSFTHLGPSLLDACVQKGCHYTDIAVERDHAAIVRAHGEQFRQAGLSAVYGCSSLPAISGALALVARSGGEALPHEARVTLFIGNKNPKGRSAIDSLVRILGQPIATPQGSILGFRDRQVVNLPPPFGKRAVFNFDSPEYDLFPDLLGVPAVSVKVGFELRLVTYSFALLACLGWRLTALTPWLERIGSVMGWCGSSSGVILVELFYASGSARRVALVARREGQRMAALPCALATRALCRESQLRRGAVTAYELLGGQRLLELLIAEGFELWHPVST